MLMPDEDAADEDGMQTDAPGPRAMAPPRPFVPRAVSIGRQQPLAANSKGDAPVIRSASLPTVRPSVQPPAQALPCRTYSDVRALAFV
eukprot:3549066-Prymnesium_polylepis.1